MPYFGDYSKHSQKKLKKKEQDKKARKELSKKTFVLPKIEIVGRKERAE